jgi:ubiquinone/menaquinone biosynthesis C-methylase UbiE
MLTKARQKLGDGIDLRVGDSEVLPWSDDSFGVVTCNLSFHHYEHPEIVLKEMHRVLRSGGRVVICDICQPFFRRLFLNLFMRFNHEGDAHIYSGKEIMVLLRRADFRDIVWKRAGTKSFLVSARASK